MNIPPGADTRTILTESMFQAICAAGGWTPSANRREALAKWASNEGVPAWIFNPFACTLQGVRSTWDLGIGVGPGRWNDANPPLGVALYASEADGANATVTMFRQSNFAPIRIAWLELDCIAPGPGPARDALVANFRLWGTTGFADAIAAGWQPLNTPAPGPPPLTLADIVAFLGGEAAVRDWVAKGNSLVVGYGALQEQAQETANKVATLAAPVSAMYDDIGRILSQAGSATTAAGRARQ